MCGFAGFLDLAGQRGSHDVGSTLRHMGEAIRERGPDDAGIWHDQDCCIGLTHRRLSIIDLSSAGHQPMVSPNGRYVVAFNGEIYNHLELRRALRDGGLSSEWKGTSDTETLLHGFETWGIQETLQRTVGMFALAIWDTQESALFLARDRLGEKPLYFGWQGKVLLFGSQLKALRRHPAFSAAISRDALNAYMRYSYVPAPHSIFEGISKLLPGHLLRISRDEAGKCQSEPYWSAIEPISEGLAKPLIVSPEEAIDGLEKVLGQAVAQCMISDVPLGAFLSGGIDSSTIVALMQARSAQPIRTFTIGYEEAAYSEADDARAIANYLGTDHTEMYVTSEQARNLIPSISEFYDEPFADPSQIPTMLVSGLAREHVKVVLSGDGGDELFAGYNRYHLTDRYSRIIFAIPAPLRGLVARAILRYSPEFLSRNFNFLPMRSIGDKLHKAADAMLCRSPEDLYENFCSSWKNPNEVVIGGRQLETVVDMVKNELSSLPPIERMMAFDTLSYLPDDIMAKVDRASMAVSLECRAPYLDHRVLKYAWQLPLDLKLREGKSKWVLRQLAFRHIPTKLLDRPKMGFGFPIDIWLRGPLREWAEELLSERRLADGSFFEVEPIRRLWSQHLAGEFNWAPQLWSVLMFQAWRERLAPL